MITIGRYFRISACRTSTTVWQAQTNWHWQQKGLYAASPELVYRLASIWRDFQSLGLNQIVYCDIGCLKGAVQKQRTYTCL